MTYASSQSLGRRRLALLPAGIVVAAAIAGCGSTKVVVIRTTVAQPKTVTVAARTPTATTSSAPTTAPAPAAPVPELIAGSWTGTKPSTIDFSGDGGNIVTGITWSSWGATGATGEGTSNLQGCVPNCAQGKETPLPTSIALSDPQGGHFTQIVEVRQGQKLAAAYASQSWPEGGS